MAAETKRFTITIPLYFYQLAERIAEEKHVTTNDILRKAMMKATWKRPSQRRRHRLKSRRTAARADRFSQNPSW